MLAPSFRLDEFERSEVAARRGWDNSLPVELLSNALRTASMLQGIRDFLSAVAGRDVPILITSGYRSPRVNAAVRGSPGSDHLQGMAADWVAPAFGSPSAIVRVLAPEVERLRIGQLIDEFPPRGWVHTSTRRPELAVNRVLQIDGNGARALA